GADGLRRAVASERRRELLDRTGLGGAGDRLAGQLSGGMRQKRGVIASMLHRPDLLVLDEPTTGIDPVSRADLWWLIARAAADGAAVLMSTTYLDEAARAAQVVVLDAGRTLAPGSPAEIVAAGPGALAAAPGPPAAPAERQRSWRRAGTWRVWYPAGAAVAGPIAPDLQDAVCVAELRAELAEPTPLDQARA